MMAIGDATAPRKGIGALRRIGRTFRPYRRRVALDVGAIVAMTALLAVKPLVAGAIVDRAFPRHDLPLLTILVLALVGTDALYWSLSLIQGYLSATIGQRVMRDLRVALYAHLQRVSLHFYTVARTGETVSRLSNDVNGVEAVVTDTLRAVLANATTMVVTFVIMLRLNAPLTLAFLALTPLFVALTYRNGRASRGASTRKQEAMADVSALLEETLNVSGALLIKSFGRQRAAVDRFAAANDGLMVAQLRQVMVGRRWSAIMHGFYALLPALVYYVGGRQVIGGTLSIGGLVAYTMLQYSLFTPLGSLLTVHADVQGALALFERIFAYLDLPIEVADRPAAHPLAPAIGYVRFRHVDFRYEPDRPTLVDVDFEARPGELVALVGPSGAGKTTITYLLARLYDVGRGAIEIDGHDVRDVTLESLNRQIGMVTQETYLHNATVRENIAYGQPDATEAEMVSAARAAHIHERIMQLPRVGLLT